MFRPARIGILFLALVCACSKGGNGPTNPTGGGGGGGGGNHPPTLSVNTSTTHLTYGAPATITVTASDPDGDQLSFAYAAAGGTVSSSGPTATTAAFTAGNQWGPASVTVTVSDGKGGTAQAIASMYVRNPNPPAITLAAVGSATCGYGTANPDCFEIQMTPAEAVLINDFYISGHDDVHNPSYCGNLAVGGWHYSAVPVGAAQRYVFAATSGAACAACQSCDGISELLWDVVIKGQRPEPDGGSFTWTIDAWHY